MALLGYFAGTAFLVRLVGRPKRSLTPSLCWLHGYPDPTRHVGGPETSELLRHHFSDFFGHPVVIILDRGSAFTGQFFRAYMKPMGIGHRMATVGTQISGVLIVVLAAALKI